MLIPTVLVDMGTLVGEGGVVVESMFGIQHFVAVAELEVHQVLLIVPCQQTVCTSDCTFLGVPLLFDKRKRQLVLRGGNTGGSSGIGSWILISRGRSITIF